MTAPAGCPACSGAFPDDTNNPADVCRCGIWTAPAPPSPANSRQETTMPSSLSVRDTQICRQYASGALVKDIAADHGLTSARISQIIREAEHMRLRRPQNAPKHVNADAMCADHLAGMRRFQIAAKHGVVPSTVTYHLRAAGLVPPAGAHRTAA